MDGAYRGGLLARRRLAGAVSGKGGSFSIGGAIAVIVSRSETRVVFEDGKQTGEGSSLTGGDITVAARDKSKLALRAGGLSISKGAAVGIGASFALIYSHNAVQAALGDYMNVTGSSLQVTARKQRVDMSDYESTFDMTMLITDSSGLSDEERENAETGIIDIHKGEDGKSYQVKFNISTDTVLDAVDLLNFLSSTNYYAESVAGSIMGGDGSSKASLAGAFSMVFFYNNVGASVGNHAKHHA